MTTGFSREAVVVTVGFSTAAVAATTGLLMRAVVALVAASVGSVGLGNVPQL